MRRPLGKQDIFYYSVLAVFFLIVTANHFHTFFPKQINFLQNWHLFTFNVDEYTHLTVCDDVQKLDQYYSCKGNELYSSVAGTSRDIRLVETLKGVNAEEPQQAFARSLSQTQDLTFIFHHYYIHRSTNPYNVQIVRSDNVVQVSTASSATR